MTIEDQAAVLNERLRRIVTAARSDPQALLRHKFEGRSNSGLVTAWVDILGKLDRVTITRDSFLEGDEELLETAVTEAIRAAQQAATDLDGLARES